MFYCNSTVIIKKYKNMNYLKVLHNTGIESLYTKYNGYVPNFKNKHKLVFVFVGLDK